MISYEQWREILRGERLPSAVVDLDAFDRNVAKLAAFMRPGTKAGTKTLRLATKSLRVPDLIRRALGFGAPYRGLMCFSAEEAEWLSSQGFDDLLVAYPTLQESDLAVLRAAHERETRISLVVDGREGVKRLVATLKGTNRPFPVVIDVDVALRPFGGLFHIGVRRSPVRSLGDVRELLAEIRRHPELVAAGAMGYEAQVAGLGDRNPFKKLMNPIFSAVRKTSMRSVARARAKVADVFAEAGVPMETFNGGGTGSVNWAAKEPWLTELSAGSALLSSHLFDYFSNVRFEPACFFALQASRRPDAFIATCLGGGYIASGEPGWDKVPRPWLPSDARLVSAEACGEVQTPVVLPKGAVVEPGSPILFRHAKTGELAERFNEYILVAGGRITGRAKTYRGLGRCFF